MDRRAVLRLRIPGYGESTGVGPGAVVVTGRDQAGTLAGNQMARRVEKIPLKVRQCSIQQTSGNVPGNSLEIIRLNGTIKLSNSTDQRTEGLQSRRVRETVQ